MLEAENISFSYNRKTFLENISVSLEPNDFIMLLGSNGSGKSTLLKLLAGYYSPMAGNVRLNEKKLSNFSSFERASKIAVVSQNIPPILDFSVRELISLGKLSHSPYALKSDPAERAAVDETMALLELEPFASRSVNTLSGGERQRVILAQALVRQPEYLLLDEPTSALDPEHVMSFMQILQKINNKIGILMVCHDLNLAWNYAKKTIILQNGRISVRGKTKEVLTIENIKENFKCEAFIEPDHGIILYR